MTSKHVVLVGMFHYFTSVVALFLFTWSDFPFIYSSSLLLHYGFFGFGGIVCLCDPINIILPVKSQIGACIFYSFFDSVGKVRKEELCF